MSGSANAAETTDDAPDDGGDDLEERVTQLESQVESATTTANRALERVLTLRQDKRDLEDRLEEAQAERDELRDQLAQLDERTDLLETVKRASGMKVEHRAAVLIQTLYNEAAGRRQKNTQDAPTASMDYKKAEGALGGGVSRDQIYRTFDRAEEIVGNDDLLAYIEEGRSSSKNSRLVLDLDEGEVPSTVAGHTIETEVR